jgi:hypothetical protein
VLLRPVEEFMINLCGMKECLAWNAADIQAGAAKSRVLFDDRRFQTELGTSNGTNIASGTSADHQDVVAIFFVHSIYISIVSRTGFSRASFTFTRNVTASRPSTTR